MFFVKEIIVVLFLVMVSVQCYLDSSFGLDVNDILDENLMPGNLLFLDGPYSNQTLIKMDGQDRPGDHGSILTAISTMGFHRKMINEYMCTNFMAEQILSESPPKNYTKLSRRVGISFPKTVDLPTLINNELPFSKPDIKENMLFDPGSTGYKNWLAKTTTLEDIYKHYSVNKPKVNQSQAGSRRLKDGEIHRFDMDDDYEGDVNGYMIHKPLGHVCYE